MKPNSCTEKAPTDVLPNQKMPVKKPTCTKNSIPRVLSKRASKLQERQAHPRADLQPTIPLQRKLARRGLYTFPTAKMQLSQERSNIHFVIPLLSGQTQNGMYFKRKSTTGTWGSTTVT